MPLCYTIHRGSFVRVVPDIEIKAEPISGKRTRVYIHSTGALEQYDVKAGVMIDVGENVKLSCTPMGSGKTRMYFSAPMTVRIYPGRHTIPIEEVVAAWRRDAEQDVLTDA